MAKIDREKLNEVINKYSENQNDFVWAKSVLLHLLAKGQECTFEDKIMAIKAVKVYACKKNGVDPQNVTMHFFDESNLVSSVFAGWKHLPDIKKSAYAGYVGINLNDCEKLTIYDLLVSILHEFEHMRFRKMQLEGVDAPKMFTFNGKNKGLESLFRRLAYNANEQEYACEAIALKKLCCLLKQSKNKFSDEQEFKRIFKITNMLKNHNNKVYLFSILAGGRLYEKYFKNLELKSQIDEYIALEKQFMEEQLDSNFSKNREYLIREYLSYSEDVEKTIKEEDMFGFRSYVFELFIQKMMSNFGVEENEVVVSYDNWISEVVIADAVYMSESMNTFNPNAKYVALMPAGYADLPVKEFLTKVLSDIASYNLIMKERESVTQK